jgi:hypothetical protein
MDTSEADMSVDVNIRPEVRGELDCIKLARLLQVLPVISATFSRANCLASVSAADQSMKALPLLPPPASELDKEITPQRVERGAEEDPNLTLPDLVDEILSEAATGTETVEGEVEVVEDPTHISMVVNLQIPEVALDLTYDVSKGRHLVLALRMLEMKIIFRPHDMQVLDPTLPCLLTVLYCTLLCCAPQ